MDFFRTWNIEVDYVILGLCGFSMLLFILLLIAFAKINKLNKKYEKFMQGANGRTLEEQFSTKFEEIDSLKVENKKIINRIEIITENLLITYQKMGIVKYDAFHEMGGKLSFAIALLNDNNDGFIINSMHSSREGCYTYIKEIIKGESFVVLAEEEKLALKEAIEKKNYMPD